MNKGNPDAYKLVHRVSFLAPVENRGDQLKPNNPEYRGPDEEEDE